MGKKKKAFAKLTVIVAALCLGLIYGFVIRPWFHWISTFSVLIFSSDAYLVFGILFWAEIAALIAVILLRQKRRLAPVPN